MLAVSSHVPLIDPMTILSTFPRGDGLFLHHGKLFVYLILYLLWIRTITWVDRDAKTFGLPRTNWDFLLMSCAVGGLAIIWIIPIFGVAYVLAMLLYASPFFIYVSQRNQKVPPPLRVFTKAHIRRWIRRNAGFEIAGIKDPRKEIPIRFIGKMSGGQDDKGDNKLAKVVHSEGYRASQELVWNAINTRATDIHMEPTRDSMIVRYRIDGILQSAQTYQVKPGLLILNVYKNLAGMDIAERRKPQDGSFSAEIEGTRLVDFRVATSGSVNGEKLVMRILDSSKQMKSLEEVGFRDVMRAKLGHIIQQPHGMLITCGPTGAGKTSTLYACMNQIDRHTRNVITLENPVEYLIDNVTQIEVNPKAGKTFAAELRSILRQDPDVILIGEVRDIETAEIACQAAQTGHMVFTTLHANDTITALGRLIDLGVKPFMVASAVSAVVGQRLVRVLCPKCRVAYKPSAETLKKLRLSPDKVTKLYRARSEGSKTGEDQPPANNCPHCGGTGYHGRMGIFELLVLNDEIRNLIRNNLDLGSIKAAALKNNYVTILEDGVRKLVDGLTSIEELQRVAK
ncbi:GspE/PulE family protein [Zavarzinella formosa]|uniref:GspE/PulE family protein n=1 Tax=Zavarzinella formosa TaxID=360055 RepID=UPI00030FBDF4|nr:GspE/PulE family protein [Zavarzinella formosa]